MKVLMFGWEFPPQISGGLGIACHGLTAGLADEGIKVLFVTPKLRGSEEIKNGTLIGASDVIVPTSEEPSTIEPVDESSASVTAQIETTSVVKRSGPEENLTHVQVLSQLTAYSSTLEETRTVDVTHWNYSFEKKSFVSCRTPLSPSVRKQIPPGISYKFSGTYGPTLKDEVEKYSIVARTIAKNYSFDVIHAHDWMTFSAGIEARKISGRPFVAHIHATEFDRAGSSGVEEVYRLEREGMVKADRVVAVSERTKAMIVRLYGIPEEKITVVHNGVTPVSGRTINFATPIGTHIVTFLGRVTYQKGPMYFVEAARKVLEQFPNAHFVVAGSGDLLPTMVERVAQLRIGKNFHFTGFLKKEHVEKVWSISDVYVMPSVSEPFGITPLEAIQAGVPVIISNQAGVGEIMPHAIKIDFWNTAALAEGICSVLKYKSLSRTLKKNSTETVRNISWNKAAQKIQTVYEELTA